MCAWCRHTRGRLGRTHGDVLDGHREEGEREEVVVRLVFFVGKKVDFLTFLEHLNRIGDVLKPHTGAGGHRQFCLSKFAHERSSRASEVHRKNPSDLANFKFEKRSRPTRSRFLQFPLPPALLGETSKPLDGSICLSPPNPKYNERFARPSTIFAILKLSSPSFKSGRVLFKPLSRSHWNGSAWCLC